MMVENDILQTSLTRKRGHQQLTTFLFTDILLICVVGLLFSCQFNVRAATMVNKVSYQLTLAPICSLPPPKKNACLRKIN